MGIEVKWGTEQETALYWQKFLRPYGYTITQGFPTNIEGGTSRFSNPGGSPLFRAFNPKFSCFTFIHDETGIPLYTKTVGITGGLYLWAGFLGMKDVIANRTPTKDPSLTNIRDRASNVSSAKEIYYAATSLDEAEGNVKQGAEFTGRKPTEQEMQEKSRNMIEFDDWLMDSYPEYHAYIVRELYRPMEAKDILSELNVTKSKADFIRKVMDITKMEGARKYVDDYAMAHAKGNWVLTAIQNPNLITKYEECGFVELDSEYLEILLNSADVPKKIKRKLKRVEGFPLMKSQYYILAPTGEKIMKSNEKEDDWFNLIKNEEDDWETEMISDPITGGMARKVATALEEMRGASTSESNRCCYNMKLLFRDYLDHQSKLPEHSKQLIMNIPCDVIDGLFANVRDEEGEKTGSKKFNVFRTLVNVREYGPEKDQNIFDLMSNELKFDRQQRRQFVKSLDFDIELFEKDIAKGIKGEFETLSGSPDTINRQTNQVEGAKKYWNGTDAYRDRRGNLVPASYGASFAQYYLDCKKTGVSNPRMMTYQGVTGEMERAYGEDLAMTEMELQRLKQRIIEKVALREGVDVKNLPMIAQLMNEEESKLYFQNFDELAADGEITMLELTDNEDLQEDVAAFLNQGRPDNKQIVIDRKDDKWRIERLKLSDKERLKPKEDDPDDTGGFA